MMYGKLNKNTKPQGKFLRYHDMKALSLYGMGIDIEEFNIFKKLGGLKNGG